MTTGLPVNLSTQTFLDLYNSDHLMTNKNQLISRMEDSYKNYLEKGVEYEYAGMVALVR